MYKIGEKIIYGKTGVCVVESIEEKTVPGGKRPYYTLKPMYQQNNVIYAPADSDKIFMRPLISRENVERLVESVPAIRDSVLAGNTVAEDADCRTCEELLHLAVGIYEKRREARKLKRKLGYTYEKRLHNAEQILFGELAAVLEIEPESVPEVLFASVR